MNRVFTVSAEIAKDRRTGLHVVSLGTVAHSMTLAKNHIRAFIKEKLCNHRDSRVPPPSGASQTR